MFMCDNLYLMKMTWAITEAYFTDFEYDQAVFKDGQAMHRFSYSEKWLCEYLKHNSENCHLAIMNDNMPIGEILFKRIDYSNRCAVFSIHLRNDSVKKKGYGTKAELLGIEYAFHELGLRRLYADVLKTNICNRG